MLENHPDKSYVEFIIKGIREGFRIGYCRTDMERSSLSSVRKNMQSADENPQVVKDYLDAELIKIHLQSSKTEQFGRGVDIYLGNWSRLVSCVSVAGLFSS